MTSHNDFLVEIHTEELPPKSLLSLSLTLSNNLVNCLQKAGFHFGQVEPYATPRRLSVLVKALSISQADQVVERKGPALTAAFDKNGHPTSACIGFARSLGVTPAELIVISNPQGEWVGLQQLVKGKLANEVLLTLVEQAVSNLPIAKRMRWDNQEVQFVRPVHAVTLLLNDEIIPGVLLGCQIDNKTRGHRFHTTGWLTIHTAAEYAVLLAQQGFVIADFTKRRDSIREQADSCVKKQLGNTASVLISSEALLNEVTGLVEWPVALCGHFDPAFLSLPKEVLISSMQEHQRYFPVVNIQGMLLPHFVTICNIESLEVNRVIDGNERVLRARLSDAAFFYAVDKKQTLASHLEQLKNILYQAKLGTLYDKSARLSQLSRLIAEKIGVDPTASERAGWLAKCDLTTQMVGEFPDLQGVMGYYYAQQDGEPNEVALAIKEHYQPRFSGDQLPLHPVSLVVALADRLDTLTGAFGMQHIPTGDKDPYGLRRAAIGILRILISQRLNLDLKDLFSAAMHIYARQWENADTLTQLLTFMQERLRSFYQDQGLPADIFASVAALQITHPFDMHLRLQAVLQFKSLRDAEALSIANKRVSHLLAKQTECMAAQHVDVTLFDHPAEKKLAQEIEAKYRAITHLRETHHYYEVLLQLAELRDTVDQFFDQVMVMTEDKTKRENRLLLLKKLRTLFLQIADIALLQ